MPVVFGEVNKFVLGTKKQQQQQKTAGFSERQKQLINSCIEISFRKDFGHFTTQLKNPNRTKWIILHKYPL